eukprot:1149945-Pelagomonas_calceolata.AAC.12
MARLIETDPGVWAVASADDLISTVGTYANLRIQAKPVCRLGPPHHLWRKDQGDMQHSSPQSMGNPLQTLLNVSLKTRSWYRANQLSSFALGILLPTSG